MRTRKRTTQTSIRIAGWLCSLCICACDSYEDTAHQLPDVSYDSSDRWDQSSSTAEASLGTESSQDLLGSGDQDTGKLPVDHPRDPATSAKAISGYAVRYCSDPDGPFDLPSGSDPDGPFDLPSGDPREMRYGAIDSKSCCGDGWCDRSQETKSNCRMDCVWCGDSVCDIGESPRTCPRDCGTCGNGTCEADESAASCGVDCGLATRVRLDRVRRCRNKSPWPCNSTESFSDYAHWEWANVRRKHQKKTFITQLSTPSVPRVKHLVFVAAGQQNSVGDDEQKSNLTGQTDGYKNGFRRKDGHKWVTMNEGIAHRVMREMPWRKDETFVALAFDARFNFEFSRTNKNRVEQAHYQWLKSKFDPSQIESIYLAGHSRGGCLVSRLAQRFANEFPNVPLIVQTFDPVCAHSAADPVGQEFGVSSHRISNPLTTNNDYFAYGVDLNARFPQKSHLAFLNLLSGDGFINFPIGKNVRAFSHLQARQENYSSGGDRPWLEQRWFVDGHNGFGRTHHQVAAMEHLRRQCLALGCM